MIGFSMPKIEWLGTPIGCPCFFSQVPGEPDEPDKVGQLVLRSPGQGLVPRQYARELFLPATIPTTRAPYLRSPSQERTRPCQGSMTLNEGHVHYIISSPSFNYDRVEISWQDVRSGVAKSYVTTEQNGHTHVLLLTAGELAGLRAGKTLTKQTSRNARQGGRQHTHTVTISCRA